MLLKCELSTGQEFTSSSRFLKVFSMPMSFEQVVMFEQELMHLNSCCLY